MNAIPLPKPESLAFRARISAVISSLRPTHFRVPVVNLEAHRIPTLWSLYRGLLRNSPTEEIRRKIRQSVRKNKGLRKAAHVRDALALGHKWAETFTKARQGDEHLQAVLQRYSRILAIREDKANWARIARNELEWREKMRIRPILTGSYLRPSFFNPPLPRLHPQPLHISGMIHSRRVARERRMVKYLEAVEWRQLLVEEMKFEWKILQVCRRTRVKFEPAFYGYTAEWIKDGPLGITLKELRAAFRRDERRALMPYPPKLLEQIKQARREKIANKTRELERERRGGTTKRGLARKRAGPPAHILATMTPKQRHMDAVSRSLSEVGYVAQVKRELGRKFKNPDAWKVEIGSPELKEMLDNAEQEIIAENERRRTVASESEEGL